MTAPVWSQVDAGVSVALGAVVATAAVRKLRRPRVFARNLQLLDRELAARPALAMRLAVAVAAYEAVVAAGVIAVRSGTGFAFACGLLVACAGFLAVLARAVRERVPCACFGSTGRTAAAGREVGRALAMLVASAGLVVHRAIDAHGAYGWGPLAPVALVATGLLIAGAQWVGATVLPGAGARAPV